jgi:polar amino acid transport system substrate-binding protein
MTVMTGCTSSSTISSSGPFNPTPAASPVPAPDNLVQKGQLTVASDLHYPPQESLDGGKPIGFDIDLARAVAAQMGLKLQVENIDISSIVPGFTEQTRRYDMGISAQPDTQTITSSAHTIRYFTAGLSIITTKANPHSIKGPDSLCGLRVGTERDTSAERAVLVQNERPCKAHPIDAKPYLHDVDGMKDLGHSDSLDAFIDDYPVAVLFARTFVGLQVIPHQFATTADVMVFPLTDDKVYNAVGAAFDRVRREGTYGRLLKRWNLEEGALS